MSTDWSNGGSCFRVRGKRDRDPTVTTVTTEGTKKNWGSVLVEELMETNVIDNRNMAILKEHTGPIEAFNPALLSDLRHDKGVRSALRPKVSKSSNSEIMMEAKRILKKEDRFKKIVCVQNKIVDEEVDRFQNHISNLRKMNQRLERIAFPSHNSSKRRLDKIQLELKLRSHHQLKVDDEPNIEKDDQFYPQESSQNKKACQNWNYVEKAEQHGCINIQNPPLKNKTHLLISGQKLEDEVLEQGTVTITNFSSEYQTMVFEKNHQKYEESERNRILHQDAALIRHPSPVGDFKKDSIHCTANALPHEVHTEEGNSGFQLRQLTDGSSCSFDLESFGPQREEIKINQWCSPLNSCKDIFDSKIELDDVPQPSLKLPPPIAPKKSNLNKLESMSKMYAKWMSNVCVHSNTQPDNLVPLKIKQDRRSTRKISHSPITREEKIMQVLHALQKHKDDKSQANTEEDFTENPRFSKSVNDIHEEKIDHHDRKYRRAISGTYENRLKAHKDVIVHQKAKLEEQKKQIEDLKLSQLRMESEKSKLQTKETFSQVFKSCNESVKAQAKSLQSSLSLIDLSPGNPFVLRMEQRALEQKQKKLLAQERRKRFEEEWKRKMKESEEKKKVYEAELMKKQQEEAQEMRRKEREIREEARREREKIIALERKADKFSEHRKLKKGFHAFKNLISVRNNQEKVAEEFYEKYIMRTYLITWKREVELRQEARLICADNFYLSNMLQRCFNALKMEVQEGKRQMQVAMDMHDLHLQERYFHFWLKFTQHQHDLATEKTDKADQHFSKVVLRKYLQLWQRYPDVAQQEREKERRKMIWRSKVQQLLPDFRPVLSSD